MIRGEQPVANETRSYRYPGMDADHAIVIHPGVASQADAHESFCGYHASRGVDVWSIGVRPERGSCPEQWVDASIALGEYVAQSTGLPVFMIGASPGAALADHALWASDVFWGAVQMGAITRDSASVSRRQHTKNGSVSYRLYDALAMAAPLENPVVSVALDTVPILYIVGENDMTLTRRAGHAIGSAAGDHAEIYVHPDPNQLMWSATFSDIVRGWCLRQLNNHLNPKWNHTREPRS